MNKAEKFGVPDIRERARRYDTMRIRPPLPEEGDDAIPLRRPPISGRQNAPPRPAGGASSAGSYRVRDAAQRAQARAQAHRTVTAETGRSIPRPPGAGRTIPEDRRHLRGAPDSGRNTDAIFEVSGERDDAIRLAHRRKAAHRSTLSALIGLLVAVFICFMALLVYKLIFVIEIFTVEGSTVYTAEQIIGATGVSAGDNLYSFSARDAEAELTLHLPYVRTLEVDRTVPDAVRFSVSEDTAVFYAELYGEVRALSATLRVLERTDKESAAARGLILLRLPLVESAISGRVLSFCDARGTNRIREVLSAVIASEMCGRITQVDLRNLHELRMVSDDAYLLSFGDADQMDLKLRLASAVLSDKLFDGTVKAELDLRRTDSTSVVFDDQITFDD